jgi:hypothetical protein
MILARRHQQDRKTFEELTFAEQARAINVRIVVLERSVTAHLRRARREGRDVHTVRAKCVNQVQRLLSRRKANWRDAAEW